MTISRRHEPFRYTFEPAVSCLIRLYEVNHTQANSKEGEAGIIDLSPNGCKLESPLNFRVNQNECKIVLSFRLANPLQLRGTILWQEQRAHDFQYGIRFEEDNQREITEELKLYSRLKMQETAADKA